MSTNVKKVRILGVVHDIEDVQARTDIGSIKNNISSLQNNMSTAQGNISSLKEDLKHLAETGVTASDIQAAVNNYLEENPVSGGIDENKVNTIIENYLNDNGKDLSTLTINDSNGNMLAEYDGSKNTSFNLPSVVAGSDDIVDVIIDTTLEEEVSNILVTFSDPVKYKEIYAYIKIVGTANNTEQKSIVISCNSTSTMNGTSLGSSPTISTMTTDGAIVSVVIQVHLMHKRCYFVSSLSNQTNDTTMNSYVIASGQATREIEMNSIMVKILNGWGYFGVGSRIIVEGVRA